MESTNAVLCCQSCDVAPFISAVTIHDDSPVRQRLADGGIVEVALTGILLTKTSSQAIDWLLRYIGDHPASGSPNVVFSGVLLIVVSEEATLTKRKSCGMLAAFLLGFSTLALAADGSCVVSARFQNTLPPGNRNTVDISGSNLKLSPAASDVESFGTDASGNNGKIHSAQSIKNCSGTQCTAVIRDLASWDTVSVHMRCGDGTWSGWVVVQK